MADTGESILAWESASAPKELPLLLALVTVDACGPGPPTITVALVKHLQASMLLILHSIHSLQAVVGISAVQTLVICWCHFSMPMIRFIAGPQFRRCSSWGDAFTRPRRGSSVRPQHRPRSDSCKQWARVRDNLLAWCWLG